jgi:amidase
VAAGLAPLAVGTETDGSITCPASLNGGVGIKPTVGTVSTERVIPISASQDSPGPMARSVADAALMLEVLSGRRGYRAAVDVSPGGLRMVLVDTWFTWDDVAYPLVRAATDVLTDLSISSAPMESIPEEVQAAELHVLLAELHDGLGEYLSHYDDLRVHSLADVVAYNNAHADLELAHFPQDFFDEALTLGGMSTQAYREARQMCVSWATMALERALADVDLLLSPAYGPAWESNFNTGDKSVGGQSTSPAAMLGWPIVNVPVGLADGLPIGMAIIGRAGSEGQLISVAAQVERALDLRLRPTHAP